MIIEPIPTADILRKWINLRPYVLAACKHSNESPALLLAALLTKPGYLMAELVEEGQVRGACIFQLTYKQLHLVTIAGQLPPGWIREMDQWMERIARENGVGMISAEGRKGWIRRLKPYGWQKDGSLLFREV